MSAGRSAGRDTRWNGTRIRAPARRFRALDADGAGAPTLLWERASPYGNVESGRERELQTFDDRGGWTSRDELDGVVARGESRQPQVNLRGRALVPAPRDG